MGAAVELAPCDPNWPKDFEVIPDKRTQVPAVYAQTIEHIDTISVARASSR
ncbi:GrpB-like predicted nucleotidyltransferase (UPF0157 family) [Rhizobium lusitanum]|uniref:GrpB-like predicted nucleotidyltransferase (UPF0157 family) n=1 Tax=Rhizobium lusitanum TaxID=293958 RepID=A0A7X0IRG3_9HYPH|nr:GrpB-like predicted nucleotidyltransferase (UPF0157 family) [Rhizobium lusitanum]